VNLRLARRRAALGLRPSVVPVTVYVPLGIVAGPSGLNVLSADVLAHLDAAISIGLATLGVFVGLALARASGAARVAAAAALESSVTMAVVAGAIAFLLAKWQPHDVASISFLAIALGACAAASAAGAAESGHEENSIASRVADLDDIVPILAAAALAGGVAAPIGIGAVVAAIGWLLFERAETQAERAVFVLGVLALLGGGAAYVGVSPLLAGLMAGVIWRILPGKADVLIADDLRKFHHPLLLLLLIVAGAQVALSPLAVWLFVPFVAFRLSGKVLGGWAASRLVPAVRADIVSAYLVPPGVVGIAIALNLIQVAPGPGQAVLAAVAGGALVFETVAAVVTPRERSA
jgi:hypothetical protein